MASINTGVCVVCNEEGAVEVTDAEFVAWQNRSRGQFVQELLPRLNDGEREQLINGTHSACFDSLFAGLE